MLTFDVKVNRDTIYKFKIVNRGKSTTNVGDFVYELTLTLCNGEHRFNSEHKFTFEHNYEDGAHILMARALLVAKDVMQSDWETTRQERFNTRVVNAALEKIKW